MKDYWFKIKVSDLLLNPWKSDIIEFNNKYFSNIEELKDIKIEWKIIVQSLDNKTIWVTLEYISTNITKECEICWKEYKQDFNVKNYFAKFVTHDIHSNPTEKIHDDEFIIDIKDEIIDIQDMIYQSIILQTPIVSKCNKCLENTVDINNYEDNIDNSFESTNNIKWVK